MTRARKSVSGWPARAARVGELLPPMRFHPAVGQWLDGHRSSGPWSVALSGGADSVALLLLLWAHWPAAREKLVVLHFNHRLRGRESLADEKFCRRICTGLGVRLRVGQWRSAPKGAAEAESRAARHGFFAREMKRLGSRVLWLAHQQDDVAETMLMRLARGSGTAGLAAPRPVHAVAGRRVHLRPLLTLKKRELTAALRAAGIKWREDASNEQHAHFRNRIRQKVLPALDAAAKRDARAGAAYSRELLEEDDAALEGWLGRLAPLKRTTLDLRALADAPRAVVRRALHRWMLAVRPDTDLSRQGFEVLLAAVVRGTATRFSLGRSGFAVIRQGKLTYRKGPNGSSSKP